MKQRLVTMALVLALVGAGCGDPDPPAAAPSAAPSPSSAPSWTAPPDRPRPGDHSLTIDVNGVRRTYLLHAPPGYTAGAPVPLVIAMHFYPGTGAAIRDLIAMDARADRHNFLVAYPDGLDRGFNAMVCCGKSDDVAFLTSLTGHLVDRWRADPDRVYLTGMSNGGDMSFRAAVEASGTFAAIGVVSGGYGGPRAEAADFIPSRPVSVVTIIGTLDRYFPVFEKGIANWQQRLRCTPATAPPPAPPVKRTVARCADGSDVDVHVVPDMGHVWPGIGGGQVTVPNAPISATDLVWDFFAAHPRSR
jgi:poly(3-hydroxybutyrate) depolymerase